MAESQAIETSATEVTAEQSRLRRWITSPHLAAILAVLIFAINYVIARGLRDELPPYTIGFVRWAGGALILAPFALQAVREDWTRLVGAWRIVVPCGFLMPFVGAGVAYVALTMTVAVNAGAVQISLPVMIILIAAVTIGERITPARGVGAAIAIVGVVVIVTRGDPAVLAGLRFNSGDLLLLLCNLGLASYAVLMKFAPRVRPVSILFALCALGGLFHVPFVIGEFLDGARVGTGWAVLGALAFFAVFPSIFAIFLWNYSIIGLGPSGSGIYMYLVPIFVAALSYSFLGETIAAYHIVGTAIIVCGVTLTSWRFGKGG